MEPLIVLREEDGHQSALLFEGYDLSPKQAVDEALAWLRAHGVGEWTLHEAGTAARPLRAFWGGDALGFVGETHPDAVAVTCVHLPGVAIPKPKG